MTNNCGHDEVGPALTTSQNILTSQNRLQNDMPRKHDFEFITIFRMLNTTKLIYSPSGFGWKRFSFEKWWAKCYDLFRAFPFSYSHNCRCPGLSCWSGADLRHHVGAVSVMTRRGSAAYVVCAFSKCTQMFEHEWILEIVNGAFTKCITFNKWIAQTDAMIWRRSQSEYEWYFILLVGPHSGLRPQYV